MTSIEPRAGGSHRRVDRGRRLRVLLVSLVVVVLAAGGVEAALHWRGESKRPAANAASSHYVSPSATPSASKPSASTPASAASSGVTSPATAPTSAPVASPAASTSATPPPPSTAPAATPSTPSPAPSSSTPAPRPPVDILNGTLISGMAARARTTVTRGGRTVALTGHYRHSTPVTPVFYRDGQLAAAQALAAQFTAIGKLSPAPAGVSTTNLTLVLGQDWTSSGK